MPTTMNGAPHAEAGPGRLRLFLRFLVVFAVVFLALQQGYLRLNEHYDHLLTHTLNAVPAAALINRLLPDMAVRAQGGSLHYDGGVIVIKKGCEGFEAMILLVAAMVAFPAPPLQRMLGALSGILFIYLCNLLRIIGIYLVARLSPSWTEVAHVAVGQTVMVLLIAVFFLFWSSRPAIVGRPAGKTIPGA